MSADVLLWMIVAGAGMIWLGFWWMRHGPDREEGEERIPRWWTYRRDEWTGPLIYFGGDEYGRRTIVVRFPWTVLVVALWRGKAG